VRVDLPRIKRDLMEITKNANDLNQLIEQNDLKPDSIALKAAKYILVELAEAMSNSIQHILAKQEGIAVSGYIDTIVKARQQEIISEELFRKLKPFFDFRNSLIHRYWTVDDTRLIQNIRMGQGDFLQFVEEIEQHLSSTQREESKDDRVER